MTQPATERAGGGELSQVYVTPNRGGRGVYSWQDESTPKENGGGFESSWGDLTPREYGGPRGDKTLGAPTELRYQWGEDGRGQGGGDENPPTARETREQLTDGGDGAA